MSARNRHRSRWTAGSVYGALLLLASGCGSIWSPSPPPPTAERVEEMRQEMALRQESIEQAVGEGLRGDRTVDMGGTSSAHVSPLHTYPNWSMQDTVADSLGRIGAPAVPDLIRSMNSPDPELRQRVASVLGRIGPDAALAVPELIRRLDDPDPRVSQAAARTLGQIGPYAAPAVPALIQRLDAGE
jgi:hypothetical protein